MNLNMISSPNLRLAIGVVGEGILRSAWDNGILILLLVKKPCLSFSEPYLSKKFLLIAWESGSAATQKTLFVLVYQMESVQEVGKEHACSYYSSSTKNKSKKKDVALWNVRPAKVAWAESETPACSIYCAALVSHFPCSVIISKTGIAWNCVCERVCLGWRRPITIAEHFIRLRDLAVLLVSFGNISFWYFGVPCQR